MKKNPDPADFNRQSRSRYIQLGKELLCQGLDSEQIRESLHELSFRDGDVCYLRPEAYQPTGIALGSPLPSRKFTHLLWRISRLTDKYFASLSGCGETTLALVPKDWYHVTLVNRTHYKLSSITLMSDKEKRKASEVICENLDDPIRVFFSGLLLTGNGCLIVPGFPCDHQLYELRAKVAKELPALSVNLPNTVHIKLGHLLTNLEDEQLLSVNGWLYRCSLHLNHILSFNDFYTAHGRITL